MTTLQKIQSKILSLDELKRALSVYRLKSKKIVFTNGVFDILHLGHIDYLAKAADEGDALIVGINTDASTRRLKGPNRPINPQEQRATVLASLHFVDAVVLFDEDTPYNLINIVQPDILIKGSDYKPDEIVGSDIVLKRGGQVKTVDLVEGYSTTLIEKKIKQ